MPRRLMSSKVGCGRKIVWGMSRLTLLLIWERRCQCEEVMDVRRALIRAWGFWYLQLHRFMIVKVSVNHGGRGGTASGAGSGESC